MIQSQLCTVCGWTNDFDSIFCFKCGASLSPNQGIDEVNQLGLYKEILFQRATTIKADGLFKSKNTSEILYKNQVYSSGTTALLITFGTSILFIFLIFFSSGSLNLSFISDLIFSTALSFVFVILVLLNSSEYVYIKSDLGKVMGKIKTKNLIRSKNFVCSDFFANNILKLEFLSNYQANFYINEERFNFLISRKEKILLKVLDTNNNIIIEIIDPNLNKYPETLNIFFSEQLDQKIVVFLTSTVVWKCLVDKKSAALENFIKRIS